MKFAEQQLLQTEENLKSHMNSWSQLRQTHDDLLSQPNGGGDKLEDIDSVMKELETRIVQEGVRAELLEEEFNSISLHLAHLGILNSEISVTSVKTVSHEELQMLKAQAAVLKDIQEERRELVEELQAMHHSEAMSTRKLHVLELNKQANSSFGFTIVGGGPEEPYVDKIVPDSAAAHAGLQCGDIIISINGRDIEDGIHEEIVGMIIRSGNQVILSIFRPSLGIYIYIYSSG